MYLLTDRIYQLCWLLTLLTFLKLSFCTFEAQVSALSVEKPVDKYQKTSNYSVLSIFSNGTFLSSGLNTNKAINKSAPVPDVTSSNSTNANDSHRNLNKDISKSKVIPNSLKPEEMDEDYVNVTPMSHIISIIPEPVQLQSNEKDTLPLPSKIFGGNFGDDADVEQTFTYQVKHRQNRKFMAEHEFLKALSSLQNLIDLRRYEDKSPPSNNNNNNESRNESNKKQDELEERMENINNQITSFLQRISELEINAEKVNVATNDAINKLENKVVQLNQNYQTHENATDKLKRRMTGDKAQIEGQIQTLTMHLRNLHNTTGEKLQKSSILLQNLTSSVQNVSNEMKTHDMRTRYNLKAITSMDKLVQSNSEKISEVISSAGTKWAEQTKGCGGVLIGDSGILSYKFRQPYQNNERCIWTIRVNRKPRVVLQLLEDGFQNASNTDFITITEFTDDHPPVLVTSSRIEHGNRAIHTFRGPLIFVSFFSDGTSPGNGFTLKFQGTGNTNASNGADTLNAIRYGHFHLKDPVGHMIYPEEKGSLYQPNEIVSFAINPPTKSLRILLRYTDMEKEESCEYDSINFYASVKASYALSKKYCDQHRTFSGESLQSSDGTFILIFRSDSSTQYMGFQFSWESL